MDVSIITVLVILAMAVILAGVISIQEAYKSIDWKAGSGMTLIYLVV